MDCLQTFVITAAWDNGGLVGVWLQEFKGTQKCIIST